MVLRLPLIANNVHPTNDLSESEEPNNLGGGDGSKGDLLAAGVTDAGNHRLRGGDGLEGSGVAQRVEERLEVGLEGGHVSVEVRGLLIEENTWRREAYGGLMFWPRKTSLPSSRPTFE